MHQDRSAIHPQRRRTLAKRISVGVVACALLIVDAHAARAGINVWTSNGPGGGSANTEVAAIAIDPLARTTLYAATVAATDVDSQNYTLFKSTDGATSWQTITSPPPLNQHLAGSVVLAIDPIMPATLYAVGAGLGFHKSTDAGTSWATAWGSAGPLVVALAVDPVTPSTLYAGTGYPKSATGIFKSTDAATSWTKVLGSETVRVIAIDPTTPTTLYAGTYLGAVFRSTDGAGSWVALAGLPDAADPSALAIDPVTPSTLYAGTNNGMFKSTDGASSWQAVNVGLANPYVVALAIDAQAPATIYAGTDGGVFKSTDGATTWSALNTGLTSTGTRSLAIDPIMPSTLYLGTFNGGLFKIEQVMPSCIGDCTGVESVAVSDLVTLVNIALGIAQPSACPNGLPIGATVNIAIILEAVNHALGECTAG